MRRRQYMCRAAAGSQSKHWCQPESLSEMFDLGEGGGGGGGGLGSSSALGRKGRGRRAERVWVGMMRRRRDRGRR